MLQPFASMVDLGSPAPCDAMPPKLGKYQIVRELGHGSTSTVYLAQDLFGGREVAVKVFHQHVNPERQAAKHARKIFLNEASLVGQLNHPHIAAIYDAVADSKQRFLVLEYVAGGTLEPYCRADNLLPIEQVVEIIYKCIRALDCALRQGVIHRDIKPANILMTETQDVKVTDFGAALLEQVDQTQISGIGSPAYMSPEQLREQPLTQQTDIYSLGVVMFELLTGHPPFTASCNAGLIYQALNAAPHLPSFYRPSIPVALDQVVLRALSKDRQYRYATWSDFGQALLHAVGQLSTEVSDLTDTRKFETIQRLSFFAGFNEVNLWEVLRITTWQRIHEGMTIIHEGDVGESFYILVEGKVRVTRAQKPLSVLHPGDCFGEMLYFAESTAVRTTSIRALTDVVILDIKASALRQASDACQVQFNQAFLKILTQKLDQTQALVSEGLSAA